VEYITFIGALCFGLMVGSFLNVVIFRLPERKSVVRPRSFCPACRKKIPWYENIPLLSYVVLRGRCSGCGVRIPLQYPAVEAVGGALLLLVVRRFGLSVEAAFVYAFLMALLAVTLIDWHHRIIPNEISLSFIVVGLVWSLLSPDQSLLGSALGALAGGGGLYAVGAIYKLVKHSDGMGGGDIKLMAMIGAFLGLKLVLPVIVLASFFGSLYGIALLRRGGGGGTAVAFGSFLAPSAAFCLFFGPDVLRWYFGHF
jgi:leader peptidase (prepilin peptidase)/N-methyltransferase